MILKGSWFYTPVEKGNKIRVLGEFNSRNWWKLILDDLNDDEKTHKAFLLVVEPEILLTSTTVSTSTKCCRATLLWDNFWNSEGDPNLALLLGNVIHLIF